MRPNDVSYRVIGAALKVHTALGAGVLESAYDTCLCQELSVVGLQFHHQVTLPVVCHGETLPRSYKVDFVVERCLVVEIECVSSVLPIHRAQLLSYLRLTGRKLGLLLNFNVLHLKDGIHRIINGPESEL